MPMTEREAIESTYFDKANIYRRKETKDEDTKQTKQTELLIAESLSCALSKNKSGSLSMEGGYGKTSGSYTLFCAPDTPILAGDRLIVTTMAGQSFTLWAGMLFVYTAHAEVPLNCAEERT